jgi:hypothetical protein
VKTKPKSLRFSEAEAEEIREYLQLTGEPEAVLLERVAMRGLRQERLEKGFMALVGGASSSEAAAIAGIGRHAFLNEAIDRGLPLLDDTPEDMYHDLMKEAEATGNKRLAAAVAAVSGKVAASAR